MKTFRKTTNRSKKLGNKERTYDGIHFKSLLEIGIYKRLKEVGFNPKYEFQKYPVMEGFYPTKIFYEPGKDKHIKCSRTKNGVLSKVLDITYTPDFTFYVNNVLIIIEGKGFKTDRYMITRKLFRKYMESMGDVLYFEIHTLKQLDEAIRIIKNL